MPRRVARWKSLAPVPGEDELCAKWLPLAKRLAADYVERNAHRPAIDFDEVYSSALLGLLEAVRTWKPGGGRTMRNYVIVIVCRRILDGLRERGHAPLSRGQWKKGCRPPVQLDDFERSGGNDWLATEPPADAGPELRDEVAGRVLRHLPCGRLRRAFALYHLEGRTLREVGAELGFGESRASQVLGECAEILVGGPLDLRKLKCGATAEYGEVSYGD